MSDEKPAFHNTPDEQENKRKEEERKVIQKEKRKEKKVLETPQPKWVETVQTILFVALAIYVLLDITIPLLRNIKYTTGNRAEIQFTKDNPEMTKAMRIYFETKVAEDKADIINAFQ